MPGGAKEPGGHMRRSGSELHTHGLVLLPWGEGGALLKSFTKLQFRGLGWIQ